MTNRLSWNGLFVYWQNHIYIIIYIPVSDKKKEYFKEQPKMESSLFSLNQIKYFSLDRCMFLKVHTIFSAFNKMVFQCGIHTPALCLTTVLLSHWARHFTLWWLLSYFIVFHKTMLFCHDWRISDFIQKKKNVVILYWNARMYFNLKNATCIVWQISGHAKQNFFY